MGGFGKEPEDYPDPYHSYLALAALSLHDAQVKALDLRPLDPRWNVSAETTSWVRSQQRSH